MSKNFELLREEGRAQELFGLPTEETATAPAAIEPAATPALVMEGMAHAEVTKLVNRLFLVSGAKAPRQVVFMGTEPGSGCSWICAHAAEILASQVTGSVCALDCDLHSPTLHREFQVENHYGLAEALVGNENIRQYAKQLSRPNLWLLSSGSWNGSSPSSLNLQRVHQRISELRAEFDYILLDTAPFSLSNQGFVLSSWSDGVALVLKANSSRREIARKALQELQAAKTPVLGAVLNQRTFPIPHKIYSRL
jgi:Mrp family chromosome partitioning ATPase